MRDERWYKCDLLDHLSHHVFKRMREKLFKREMPLHRLFIVPFAFVFCGLAVFFKEEIQLKVNMWPAYDTNCTLAAVHCMIDLQYFHCNWYITAHETVIAYLNRSYVLFQRFYFDLKNEMNLLSWIMHINCCCFRRPRLVSMRYHDIW